MQSIKDNRIMIAISNQWRVIFALILRGMRTRFFGSGLGYIVAIAWPLLHILIIVLLFALRSRVAPYGESTVLFIATGAIPFMVFSYTARNMMLGVINSKPLISFPQVKTLDLLISNVIMEVLSSTFVVLILVIIGLVFDLEVWPVDIVQCIYAIWASVFLGVGYGLFNSAIALFFPMWVTVSSLFIILLWATSGVFFVPDALPEYIRQYAAYHPTLQIVEWMRSAYFEGYGDGLLDRNYVLFFALTLCFCGLFIEKELKGSMYGR
jgi:capsular polysaccharide transport system permease protein